MITFFRYTKAITHLQQHIMNQLVNSLAMWALSFNNIPSINEFSHIGDTTPMRRYYEVIFTDIRAIITGFRVTTTRTKCSAFKDLKCRYIDAKHEKTASGTLLRLFRL